MHRGCKGGPDRIDPPMLLAVGFEEAFIGEALRCGFSEPVAAYDYGKCLEILTKDGMTREEAVEYFEYNALGSWLGEQTPVFVERGPPPCGEKSSVGGSRPSP